LKKFFLIKLQITFDQCMCCLFSKQASTITHTVKEQICKFTLGYKNLSE
jgi:hypothetical protein